MMNINVLIPPAAAWQPPSPVHAKPPARQIVFEEETWEDHAVREEWREAVLGYLKAHWRGATPLWQIVNSIVAESLPEDRWESRENTKATLRAVMQLIRERIVLRYRRKWVALIDVGHETIPLERIPRGSLRRL